MVFFLNTIKIDYSKHIILYEIMHYLKLLTRID